ncbi:MAG: rRNA maturation RNase YbeY [Mucilaginibacter sp.]|uniref:rRNA maturation RNase YbeY n=1 Tax=Mucilaginibacter sp. TaxID=1882438 RepID=UPI0034E5C73F
MPAKINFFTEETDFKLKNKKTLRTWIEQTLLAEKRILKEINFVFCNDAYLLKINQDFLQHDTYTDIITFDNSETAEEIVSDIFISVERVAENAKSFQTPFLQELHRVMIHGVLHLAGYKDKSAKDVKTMRSKENFYLSSLEPV